GSGLAVRWAVAGYNIKIGSRSQERGEAAAVKLISEVTRKTQSHGSITGGDNEFATESDIIVLAIPADQVEFLLIPLKHNLQSKIVLDVTVNLKYGKFPRAELVEGKSSYEYVRSLFPETNVVACFKTISAELLQSNLSLNQSDFQIALDDSAFMITSKLATSIGLTPIRIRGKVHSHTIERMVAMAIQINKEYPGSHAGYYIQDVKLNS
ncbi:MAG: NADPH-dependent F420 reductase, partial [Candidatus Heimdallarchaeota archaeon]